MAEEVKFIMVRRSDDPEDQDIVLDEATLKRNFLVDLKVRILAKLQERPLWQRVKQGPIQFTPDEIFSLAGESFDEMLKTGQRIAKLRKVAKQL
jgi:hypothetical protein